MDSNREKITNEIQGQADEIIELCTEFIKRPSPNPPGNTRLVAQRLTDLLSSNNIPFQIIEEKQNTPNIISSIQNGNSEKWLLFLGHMDTYPVGEKTNWKTSPFKGNVENGRIYGRGSGDMKSGLTALIYSYLFLAKTNQFNGRLTFLAVSDEENFSPHGANYVMKKCPELIPNAVICGEPTGMDRIAYGEKGMVWIEIFCNESPGHGALSQNIPNAIEDMVALLMDITKLRTIKNISPNNTNKKQEHRQKKSNETTNIQYYSEELLSAVTVNLGLISGGRKINMIADDCQAEVDIRLPPGVNCTTIIEFIDKLFSKYPNSKYDVIQMNEANWSNQNEDIFKLLKNNIESQRDLKPRMEFDIPASDARLFRARGIPSALYGPRIYNPAAANEYILSGHLIDSVKVYTLTAHDFLS